jgi:hypothetical protein
MTAVMRILSLLLLQLAFYYFEDGLVEEWPAVCERSDSEFAN